MTILDIRVDVQPIQLRLPTTAPASRPAPAPAPQEPTSAPHVATQERLRPQLAPTGHRAARPAPAPSPVLRPEPIRVGGRRPIRVLADRPNDAVEIELPAADPLNIDIKALMQTTSFTQVRAFLDQLEAEARNASQSVNVINYVIGLLGPHVAALHAATERDRTQAGGVTA